MADRKAEAPFAARPLAAADFNQWRDLYQGYADFYQTPINEDTFNTVWAWILGGEIRGLAAVGGDGALCGIAHWEKILRPLRGLPLAYLHDLYVPPEARRGGVGEALIAAVGAAAKAEGCTLLRWATKADNLRARSLYDRVAAATEWVIYEKPV